MIDVPYLSDGARRKASAIELLWSPEKPAIQVASALDRVRRAPAILDAMRTVPDVLPVVDAAVSDGTDSHALLEPMLDAIADESDTITALAAVHALARVPGPGASLLLAELITDADLGFAEHALWATSSRPVSQLLVWPVARAIARGGVAGMHAQRTLAAWAATDQRLVLEGLRSVLREVDPASARRYLVETMGLVPGASAGSELERIALDTSEAISTRRAAIEAFGDRITEPLPASFAAVGDELAPAVRSVRGYRQLVHRRPRPRQGTGMRVAQIHLGQGGGLATLLPQLGDALAGHRRVAELLTIVRAGVDASPSMPRHRIDRIALEPGEGGDFSGGWPSVVTLTRGIRSAFLARALPDVVHLRMADPGTYAAAGVARSLGLPIVFTLAPDPHAPLAAAESAGTLDRRSFAARDARDALWFRARLVERVAHQARELVLFPREHRQARLEALTSVELSAGRPRHTVVAEGIDLDRLERATEVVRDDSGAPPVLLELQASIGRLPRERHGLPLVVSVGRMVELKGMARLVEAFALDESLAARANLVIVGGNLADPSAAEAAELARIQRHLDDHPGLSERMVLLGQRPHADVALVLAAAHRGWRSLIGPGGSYVCASAKEEFGLAIIEALASGLPVAAPRIGGPATYVEAGRTGTLVDTTDSRAIATGVAQALDLAADPATARRTRELVEKRYTLDRMARSLVAVYRITAGATALADPEEASTIGAA